MFRALIACFVVLSAVSAFAGSDAVLVADETSSVVQNDRANDDNLSRMRDSAMLRQFVRSGHLVRVPSSTPDYYIHAVPSSYRYTRPWTKTFLTRLSRQFSAKFGHRLRVTSLVRTANSQQRLARVNGNAADATGPARSSHLTGATIDISKRFMSAKERQWMRDVLYSLREQGYLFAIEEFSQPTFHIMVYRNYPEYVRLVSRRPRQLQAKSDSHEEEIVRKEAAEVRGAAQ